MIKKFDCHQELDAKSDILAFESALPKHHSPFWSKKHTEKNSNDIHDQFVYTGIWGFEFFSVCLCAFEFLCECFCSKLKEKHFQKNSIAKIFFIG